MTTEKQLMAALKSLLKQQGKTYRDVAEWLALSEGSVKRLFSKGDMRLDRLMTILSQLGRTMTDLVSTMDAESKHISQISEAQERELVDDMPALLTALAVLSQLPFDDIVEHYGFAEVEVENALLKLDKMRIISLLPNNHYQLNVHANFRWLAGGPIQRFFMDNLAANYVSQPLGDGDELLMLGAMLSATSNQKLDWLMDDFLERFQQLNIADRPLPLAEKSATFVVLAKRQNWYRGNINNT